MKLKTQAPGTENERRWTRKVLKNSVKGLLSAGLVGCTLFAFYSGTGTVSAAGKKYTIKFATLAPEGSSWMKEMRKMSGEIKKKTGGNVSFKFYPGGVSGDERDVIRKMRIGQLHGAGFTGVGLGEILSSVRVLDLPFLFDTDEQINHVYRKMNGHFAGLFEKKGYVLLGWVPVGWVHFFSSRQIQTVQDLKKAKAWMWEGDPLVEETYKALQIKPVPLSITEVLISLQTGLVDTVYASSQGALALQWFTKVKYMSQVRMGYATGGVLITKKKFNSLPSEYQKIVKEVSSRCLKELVRIIQEDNDRSIQVMLKNGVQEAGMPDKNELDKFHRAGAVVREKLIGKLFSKELLQTVLTHLNGVK